MTRLLLEDPWKKILIVSVCGVFLKIVWGMFMVLNVCLFVNLILEALSSEFHPTSSTSESPQKKEQWEKSEQKTKIMETAKLEGEK